MNTNKKNRRCEAHATEREPIGGKDVVSFAGLIIAGLASVKTKNNKGNRRERRKGLKKTPENREENSRWRTPRWQRR